MRGVLFFTLFTSGRMHLFVAPYWIFQIEISAKMTNARCLQGGILKVCEYMEFNVVLYTQPMNSKLVMLRVIIQSGGKKISYFWNSQNILFYDVIVSCYNINYNNCVKRINDSIIFCHKVCQLNLKTDEGLIKVNRGGDDFVFSGDSSGFPFPCQSIGFNPLTQNNILVWCRECLTLK